jgi:hypothetical protein
MLSGKSYPALIWVKSRREDSRQNIVQQGEADLANRRGYRVAQAISPLPAALDR